MPTLHTPLRSSALASATFEPDDEDDVLPDPTGTLEITFTSGDSYSFDGVPLSVFEGLAKADSPGRYYHANIRDQY